MSNGYKTAMDKIALSDEAKSKIVRSIIAEVKNDESCKSAANTKIPVSDTVKARHIRRRVIKYIAGIAACLLVCAMSLPAVEKLGTFTDNASAPVSESSSPVPQANEGGNPEEKRDADTEAESAEKIQENSRNANQNMKKNDSVDADFTPEYKSVRDNNAVTKSVFETDIADSAPLTSTDVEVISVSDAPAPDSGETAGEDGQFTLDDTTDVEPQTETDTEEVSVFSESATDSAVITESSLTSSSAFAGGSGGGGMPVIEFESIGELKEHIGYSFDVPHYMPEGYDRNGARLIAESLVEISYDNGESAITYRTERGAESVSGDYREYESSSSAEISGTNAVIKNDEVAGTLAEWSDGESAYSINADEMLDEDETIRIIENVW